MIAYTTSSQRLMRPCRASMSPPPYFSVCWSCGRSCLSLIVPHFGPVGLVLYVLDVVERAREHAPDEQAHRPQPHQQRHHELHERQLFHGRTSLALAGGARGGEVEAVLL